MAKMNTSKVSKAARKSPASNEKITLVEAVGDLGTKAEDLNGKIEPLLEFFDNEMKYEKGDEILDYLRVKKQLLLSYVTNLMFYIKLKLEGKSCASHPVMDSMLELRYAMEKMRPMDGKLKYQIDRLVEAADNVVGGQGDQRKSGGGSTRPNPMALLAKDDGRAIVDKLAESNGNDDDDDEEEEGEEGDENGDRSKKDDNEGDGIYRPPRMEAAFYMDAETKAEKQEAALKRKRKKLKNSEIFDALREEFTVAPEMSTSTGISGLSGLEKKLREDANERTNFEEERFIRMTQTRKEKQAIKRKEREISQTNILGGFGNVDDLDDLVDSFKEVSESGGAAAAKKMKGGSLGMNGRGDFAFDDDSAGKGKKSNAMAVTTSAASSQDAITRAAMAFSRGDGSKATKKKKKKSH